MSLRPIRVLIAKPGLDGHDRGAKLVSRALRDAGMEVIYTGLRQTAEQIAEAALQEDVDVVGLSSLSGAHETLFPMVLEQLKVREMDDVIVIAGGIIPPDDAEKLQAQGISKIFAPGTPTDEIVTFVREAVREKRQREQEEL